MKCPFCIKVCSKCKRILVANEMNFNKNKGGKYGLRNDCKDCKHKYTSGYHQDNKNYINNKRKKRYENNKEKEKERQRRYHAEHKEERKKYSKKYREEHSEEIKEKGRIYRENNPHINFNNQVKRRLLEENQGNGITKEQWFDMMEFFGWKCAYSGMQLDRSNRSVDHVIPLNNNGEHEVWNCVPMYMPYNSSKNTNNMLEWYIQQEFYSEERLNKIYEWIEYAKNKYQK